MLWKVRKKLLFKAKEWGPKIDILGATCEQRNVPPPQIFPHKQPSGSKPVCIIVYQPRLIIGVNAVFIFTFQQKTSRSNSTRSPGRNRNRRQASVFSLWKTKSYRWHLRNQAKKRGVKTDEKTRKWSGDTWCASRRLVRGCVLQLLAKNLSSVFGKRRGVFEVYLL